MLPQSVDPATPRGPTDGGPEGHGAVAAPTPTEAPAADVAAAGAVQRRRVALLQAGHRGDEAAVRPALGDSEAVVWGAALDALARMGHLRVDDVCHALTHGPTVVRRRAVALTGGLGGRGSRSTLPAALRSALDDQDPLVTEGACAALGERRDRAAVAPLGQVADHHPDLRCREAAVAALGAIGDPAGLPFVLAALEDRPTVRRRATVALSAFGGDEVEAALRRSAADRDWQVREVAEILLGLPPGGNAPG